MDARIERIVMYVVVLGLAIAVVWLAVTIQEDEDPNGNCAGCEDGLKPRLNAIDAAIDDLGKTVANVADAVDRGLAGFGQELAGLEGRVADAVSRRLLAAGCQVTRSGGECVRNPTPQPPHPAPVTVNSRFTFLYENARLNEDGKLAPNSVGVKLTDRHLDRLRLLASAFKPCHEKDDPVRFAVTGYASSAEFRSQPDGGPLPDSEALNRETANLRARIVRDYLRSQGFEVEPPRSDLPRPYRDDAQPGMDQQALNRTVFMELVSAGACGLSR